MDVIEIQAEEDDDCFELQNIMKEPNMVVSSSNININKVKCNTNFKIWKYGFTYYWHIVWDGEGEVAPYLFFQISLENFENQKYKAHKKDPKALIFCMFAVI